ncbi:interactor of constitutive active ROPs 4-like [Chenopodium quinoa]|uniref:interactor of constitutive active ROPs 4-like n=1 Tax=Chenopodium quinoa TaxID=63459 RepID=UPI000B787450|nr:interactor of constitutive active ROPs 4-like [Chenopodium quinoa]XP_021764669.1 interactor of constitutive active ROPs 4-like [Chenopodium quinoa]XP_021764670.1 interactor of constitutive active ROPs 4-like [Chenopodium quinoa]
MPRVKGTEGPQRPPPTIKNPRHLRTSSSDSDPLHHRSITERSPRIGDYRSPRGTQSEPVYQKKLGTRITDLETQLVQAQHELKSLKHQLSSAEAARKQAQEELHKKGSIKKQVTTRKVVGRAKPTAIAAIPKNNSRDKPGDEVPEVVDLETDVFEVPVEKMLVEPKTEVSHCSVGEDVKETKSEDSSISEPEKPSLCDEAVSKNEEMDQIRAEMEEKEKEKQVVIEENQALKMQLDEAKSEIDMAQKREEEMALKLNQLGEDIELSRGKESQVKEKLVEAEAAKELLEIEMKKMKVQTEQWRKAADAAASVLAGGAGTGTKGRISERCASMDNHFNSIFEPPPITGFGGYLGSPGAGDDPDDSFGGGKKKGSGIKMLGDLWKRKGQK